jgi:hypothetical protein
MSSSGAISIQLLIFFLSVNTMNAQKRLLVVAVESV